MKHTNSQVLSLVNEIEDPVWLVSILALTAAKLDINTISGMADSENKTPRGITTSNAYRKVRIGRALLAVKGVRDLNSLPF